MTDVELSGRIPLVRHTSLIVRLVNLIKAVFALLFSPRILDALHLGLTIHAMYYYMITNFMNPRAQLFVVWSVRFDAFADRGITHPCRVGA